MSPCAATGSTRDTFVHPNRFAFPVFAPLQASVSASRPEPDLAAVFTEAIGHAACDILRRVIGPAKVADIKGQPEKERRSLELGHKLLLASARTTTVDDVVALLNRRE